jgi:hypothetical protein
MVVVMSDYVKKGGVVLDFGAGSAEKSATWLRNWSVIKTK